MASRDDDEDQEPEAGPKIGTTGDNALFIKRIVLTPNGKHAVIGNDNTFTAMLSVLGNVDRWLKYPFSNGALPPETPTVRMTASGGWMTFRAKVTPGLGDILKVELQWATQLDSAVSTECDFSPVKMVAAAVAAPGQQATRGAELSPDAPNIVVIMADDLDLAGLNRLITLGAMPYLRVEVIDQGTTFNNAFVTNSLCCPSRATFLTGLYSHNHGVRTNTLDGGVSKFDDRRTLATWLQAGGYRTGHVGKYLNGYGREDLTGDGWVTAADRQYVPPGWSDWQALLDPYKMYEYRLNDNRVVVTHGSTEADYQTDVLARRAARFIADATRPEHQGAPFFLEVMLVAPHVENTFWMAFQAPWQWDIRPAPRHEGTLPLALPSPPSYNERDVSDKPGWVQEYRPRMNLFDTLGMVRHYRHRLESVRAIDDLVGTVVTALRSAGALENTVLIFTSDNGFLHGEHRMTQKLVAYDEAIRVPLIVRMPGSGRSTRSQFVLNNDLAPTIAELAGVVPDLEVDGTSFLPLLRDPATEGRRRFLVEHWQALPDLRVDVPTYWGVRARETGADGVLDALFVRYEDPAQAPEFFDLTTDPHELANLHAASDPTRLRQRQVLSDWSDQLRACRGAACVRLEFARSTEGAAVAARRDPATAGRAVGRASRAAGEMARQEPRGHPSGIGDAEVEELLVGEVNQA